MRSPVRRASMASSSAPASTIASPDLRRRPDRPRHALRRAAVRRRRKAGLRRMEGDGDALSLGARPQRQDHCARPGHWREPQFRRSPDEGRAPLEFATRFEARNGPFAAYGDFFWAKLRASGSALALRTPLSGIALTADATGRLKFSVKAILEGGGASSWRAGRTATRPTPPSMRSPVFATGTSAPYFARHYRNGRCAVAGAEAGGTRRSPAPAI